MFIYRKIIDEMPAYDGVERDYSIKVNANESPLNLPPIVEERVLNRLSYVAFNRYPNEEYHLLVEQISKNFSVDKSQILLGNGSSEIIEKIFQTFGGDGKKIIFPQPSFSMYKIYAKAAEANAIPFDLDKNFDLDVDKFIKKIHEVDANLAVICNPNNPTGNALTVAQISEIAKAVDCPLLIDEAYVEFFGHSAFELIKKFPNLIVARTFSKAYGMAGARVGYMIANADVTKKISKIFMPYHMNTLTLAAADIVYQMRDEFVPRIQMLISERKRMAELLSKINGVKVFPSNTNFLLIRLKNAEKIFKIFESEDIGVRYFFNAKGLENCLRISMGTRLENDKIFSIINDTERWS